MQTGEDVCGSVACEEFVLDDDARHFRVYGLIGEPSWTALLFS